MFTSIDPLHYHDYKISATAFYFYCYCCWIFSGPSILCHFRIFLFHLRVLIFQNVLFLSFSWLIMIYILWTLLSWLFSFHLFLSRRLRLLVTVIFFLVLSILAFLSFYVRLFIVFLRSTFSSCQAFFIILLILWFFVTCFLFVLN